MKEEDDFLRIVKIYSILVVQLIVTFYIVWVLRGYETDFTEFLNSSYLLVYFIFTILLILSFTLLPSRGYFYTRLFIFTLFAFLKSVLIYIGTKDLDDNTIEAVMISTLLTFGGMTFIGYILYRLGYNIGWMLMYLVVALLGLLIAHVVMMLRPPDNNTKKIVIYIGIGLFSLFVMYDTNNMLIKETDSLSSAMDFYLDFINLFIRYIALEEM